MFIAPFLYLTIWYHSWIGLGFVILWTIVNSFIFPKPKRRKIGSLMLSLVKGCG